MSNEMKRMNIKLIDYCIKAIGCGSDNKIGPLFVLILLLYVVTFVQIVVRQLMPWNKITNRILSLENLSIVYFNMYFLIELTIFPKNLFNLIQLLKRPIHEDKLPLSVDQQQMRKQQIEIANQDSKRFLLICVSYVFVNGVLPAFVGIIQINTKDMKNLIEEDITSPLHCWLPFSTDTNLKYLVGIIPQLAVRILILVTGTNWCYIMIGTMKYVSDELKLLTSYVTEMDERLGPSPDEHNLKVYLAKIVDHHVAIIRCTKIINDHSKVMMLGFNQLYTFEICIAFYCITEVKDLQIQIRFVIVLFVTFGVLGYFSSFGQKIIDEANNLRMALEMSSWIDKPESYKKLFRIVLTNMHKPLNIKPANLYILNLIHVMKVMKASYSYFNVMQSIKK